VQVEKEFQTILSLLIPSNRNGSNDIFLQMTKAISMMHLTLNNGVKSLLKLTLIHPYGGIALLRRLSPYF
jgi:hypothetical protein